MSNRQELPQELELRHRLGEIEEELKGLEEGSRDYNRLLGEHQRLVEFLGGNEEIRSLEDVKDYNSRSLSKPLKNFRGDL